MYKFSRWEVRNSGEPIGYPVHVRGRHYDPATVGVQIGASLLGSAISGDAAQSAADTQANAANNAAATQLQMFNTVNQQQAPYRQAGQNALAAIQSGLGIGGAAGSGIDPNAPINPQVISQIYQAIYGRPSTDQGEIANAMANFKTAGQLQTALQDPNQAEYKARVAAGFSPGSAMGAGGGAAGGIDSGYFTHQFNANDLNSNLAPNYEFVKQQGIGAAANAGNLVGGMGGNTLKGITDYATNLAGNAYQQAFNNYTTNQSNIFNRLSNVAGLGQTANQNTGSAAIATGQNVGNAQMAAGQAGAAGQVGMANALSGGLSNAASWYSLPSLMNGGGQLSSTAIPSYGYATP